MPKVLHLKGIEHERLAPSAHPGESHRKRVINVRFARKHVFFFFWSPFVQAAFVAFPLKYTVTHLRGIIKVLLGVIPCLAYVTMDLKD